MRARLSHADYQKVRCYGFSPCVARFRSSLALESIVSVTNHNFSFTAARLLSKWLQTMGPCLIHICEREGTSTGGCDDWRKELFSRLANAMKLLYRVDVLARGAPQMTLSTMEALSGALGELYCQLGSCL